MPTPRAQRLDIRYRPATAAAVIGAVAISLGGCSSAFDLMSVDMTALGGAPTSLSRSPVSAQETYIRLARGAHACWFGGRGAFRETHVFYAEAEPSTKGGVADIVIHERDRTSERPWGLKALRIHLKPVDAQTDVSILNLKMGEADAQRMTADVARWIVGQEDCAPAGVPSTAAQKP
jgi:hypothetical protein